MFYLLHVSKRRCKKLVTKTRYSTTWLVWSDRSVEKNKINDNTTKFSHLR